MISKHLFASLILLLSPLSAANVYIIAGQSNALGQGNLKNTSEKNAPRLKANPSVQIAKAILNINTVKRAHAKQTTYTYHTYRNHSFSSAGLGSGWDSTFGVEIGLVESLTKQGVEDIYIIKFAVGGASLIENFSKAATGPPLYNDLITMVKTHLKTIADQNDGTYSLNGMYWIQGEADASNAAHTKAYQHSFQTFLNNLRTDIGHDELKVAFVPLNEKAQLKAAGSVAKYRAHSTKINQDLSKLADQDPLLYIAPSPHGYSIYDHVHYTGDAYLTIGTQLGSVLPIPR